MNLTEQDKEDITDMIIDSRDVEEELTADEMFSKMGYVKKEEKFQNDIDTIEYRQIIKDDLYDEIVKIIELNNPKFYKYPIINLAKILKSVNRESNIDLSLKELQAIHLKCKELRWLDE